MPRPLIEIDALRAVDGSGIHCISGFVVDAEYLKRKSTLEPKSEETASK